MLASWVAWSDAQSLLCASAFQVNWVGGPIKGQALAEYTTHPAPGFSSSNFCVLPRMPGFWGLYRGVSAQAL